MYYYNHFFTYSFFSSTFSTFVASACRFAKVSATRMGKTRVASAKIFTYLASNLNLAHV